MASHRAIHHCPSNFGLGDARVQIAQFESPPLLPRLDALDAEFGCGDEQRGAERIRVGGGPMSSTFTPTKSEFPTDLRAARATVDAMKRSSLDPITIRPSLARRGRRGSARFI